MNNNFNKSFWRNVFFYCPYSIFDELLGVQLDSFLNRFLVESLEINTINTTKINIEIHIQRSITGKVVLSDLEGKRNFQVCQFKGIQYYRLTLICK